MNNKHWHALLLPSLLLGAAWLLVSGATTAYIYWLDDFHRRLLTDNVSSIRASARMQHALWKLHVRNDGVTEEFRDAFRWAQDSAMTPREKESIAIIFDRFAAYQSLKQSKSHDPAAEQQTLLSQIADECDRFRKINSEMMDARLADYERWVPVIGWGRLILVVFGPVVGVWLGFRVARRFRDRIAAINLTLDGSSRELAEVHLSTTSRDDDLDELDRQVQSVALRFQKIVSQLDDARKEALRNERLAAIGHLAAGVAHEIRNPLTAVKLLIQNASQKSATRAWTTEQSLVVRDEISRIERIIQDLLDFAKPTTSQQINHEVCNTIQRAVRLVQGRAEQSEIKIEVLSDGCPTFLIGDPEQLHQVFVNLLMNGMDEMSAGGTLSIEICRRSRNESEDLSVDYPRRDDLLTDGVCQIAVRDDGKGIPLDILDRIFEPFVTNKPSGTGLGLAISRQIIEAHGGTLTALNRINGGTQNS